MTKAIQRGAVRLLTSISVFLVLGGGMTLAQVDLEETREKGPTRTKSLNFDRGNLRVTGPAIEAPRVHLSPVQVSADLTLGCGIKLQESDGSSFYFRNRRSSLPTVQTASFSVNWIGDWGTGDGPAAQAAFNRALATWASLLTSNVTIYVDAEFGPLAAGVLGSAGANGILAIGPFTGAGLPAETGDNLLLGRPLAEATTGSDSNAGAADIGITFSSAYSNWHFGTGTPPAGKIDFESVVLHELGHGLDFAGLIRQDDGDGTAECDGTAGSYCQWFAVSPTIETFRIWNYFLEDEFATALWDKASFPDHSAALADAVTDSLFWSGSQGVNNYISSTSPMAKTDGAAYQVNTLTAPLMYTPDSWEQGSSFSHLSDSEFSSTNDNLMTPAIAPTELAREPGSVTCGMMNDMGWDITVDCPSILPVELTEFVALARDHEVYLRWSTATEANNAGFEVQRKMENGEFVTHSFVAGTGTSTETREYSLVVSDVPVGKHSFRLKQLDYDGTSDVSPEVEVLIALPSALEVEAPYPNPSTGSARLAVTAGQDQDLEIALFDVTGRQIRDIFRSHVSANERRTVQIDTSNLATGTYVVRVTGALVQRTQQLTVVN